MTQETKTQERSAVAPLFSPEKIAEVISFVYTSESKKSARLSLTQHEGYDKQRDFHAKSLTQADAAIAALTKVAEGMIWGTKTLIITAPPEKLVANYGMGTYGYVHSEHDVRNPFTFVYDGEEYTVPVTAEMVPQQKGWVRLSIDARELYIEDNEPLRDMNFNNGWSYYYCQTLSAIVSGANISIGLGPIKIPDGLKVMSLIVNSDDPVAGVGEYRFTKRELGRAYEATQVHAEDLKLAQENGEKFSNDDPALLVPLAEGGEISLATWNHLKKVPIVSSLGQPLGGLAIKADSTAARLAVARTIHECGYLVEL